MNKYLELAQDKFIERIGNMCNKFGLNDFIAQLFTVLYFNGTPLSLDELTTRLRASKGNISINIRELERWGAVKKVWVKGSRKDYYQAVPDIKTIFFTKVKLSMQKRMAEVSDMLEEANEIIAEIDGELTAEERMVLENYQRGLKKLEELRGLISTALTLSEKFI